MLAIGPTLDGQAAVRFVTGTTGVRVRGARRDEEWSPLVKLRWWGSS
jgi:hypothetical protein